MAFLYKLLGQTENYTTQAETDSKINDMKRYKPTLLPGQSVHYPSFAAKLWPNSYIEARDRLDPRFTLNYAPQ